MRRKREYGEGAIYQRRDGLWVASVRSKENSSRKYLYAKTRNDAKLKLVTYKESVHQHLAYDQATQSLKSFVTSWLEQIQSRLRPHILREYTRYINYLLRSYEKLPLNGLQAAHIAALYQKELKRVSASHVVHLHRVVHKMLQDAVYMRLLPYNPADNVQLPRWTRAERPCLNEQQVNDFLLVSAMSAHLHCLFALALFTGMREGELLGLQWDDIDQETRTIYIRRTLHHVPGHGVLLLEPKTSAGRRTIPYANLVARALKERRTAQIADQLKAGGQWQKTNHVFTNAETGVPLRAEYVRDHFYELLERAGLPRIHFHDLRHTATSLLLSHGEEPKQVQRLLGHADIAVTMAVYAHADESRLPAMLERHEGRFMCAS